VIGATVPGRRSPAHVFVADIETPSLRDDDRRHLLRVLRLRAGEAVSVADGTGWWRPCTLVGDGDLEPAGDVVWFAAPSPAITVALSVPKGDRPEWAVQKLTEIGVDRIVVLHADRSVVRWDGERGQRHLGRLAAVAKAAAMQSRRLTVPTVNGPTPVAALALGGSVALAEPGGGPPSLDPSTVAVGPEGGWSPAELDLDLPRMTLGPSILRTETAAVVAATLMLSLRSGLVTPRIVR
jgi:16S rRNA (uracil1498-N3)-methyltransferase